MTVKMRFKENTQKLAIGFFEKQNSFAVNFSGMQVITQYIGDPYEGEYEITPMVTAQTMPTKNKTLTEDLTVLAIPYHDVSNTAGGRTIYIGG